MRPLLLLLLFASPLHAQFSPGFVDTLEAIAGKPRSIDVLPLPPGWLGAYFKVKDVIVISPVITMYAAPHRPDSLATWETRMSPDWVISHEFGHRFDSRRSLLPSRVWIRESYAIRATCDYANAHPEERWAEAFANAVDFLRFSGSEPGHALVLRSLAQRESYVPGTSDVVAYLLRLRVFRAHPLNRLGPWRTR